jgi:hypothetical protein
MGRAITLLGGVSLAAGESVVAVAEPLGHENTTLALTTYGHLMLDSEIGYAAQSTPRGRPWDKSGKPIMANKRNALFGRHSDLVAGVGFEPLRRTFRLGAMPRNAPSLGILLLGIARPYS